jgi:hypothetical protein
MRAAAEDFKPFAVTWLLGEGLELSRVHWLRPEVLVEVAFSTWTADGLIKQASYQCPRQDRPARPGDRGQRRSRSN